MRFIKKHILFSNLIILVSVIAASTISPKAAHAEASTNPFASTQPKTAPPTVQPKPNGALFDAGNAAIEGKVLDADQSAAATKAAESAAATAKAAAQQAPSQNQKGAATAAQLQNQLDNQKKQNAATLNAYDQSTPAAAMPNLNDPSVNQNSNKNKDNNAMGQVMSMGMAALEGGMGVALINGGMGQISAGEAQVSASPPLILWPPTAAEGFTLKATGEATIGAGQIQIAEGALMIGMAMQSLAQAAAHGDTANQSANTGALTNGTTSPFVAGDYSKKLAKQLPPDKYNFDAVGQGIKAVNAANIKGLSINPNKGTITYKGKETAINSLNSAAAMEAAGFPKSAIASALASVGKASDEVIKDTANLKGGPNKNTLGGFDDSGGGALAGSSSYGSGNKDDFSSLYGKKSGADQYVRGPAQIAGLQKKFNGEPIGISADSIFNMMTRRYKLKEQQNSFYEEHELNFKK